MGIRKNIGRVLLGLLWAGCTVAMVVLLAAAMREKKEKQCHAVDIFFVGDAEPLFLDEGDVLRIMTDNGKRVFKGKVIRSLDLNAIEQRLLQEVWIADAEVYLDNLQTMKAVVRERQPVARVFTLDGSSFYMDSARRQIPVTHKRPLQLPVFTSYPDESNGSLDQKELDRGILEISRIIVNDAFWKAFVSQVHVTADLQFELIPGLGECVIELGDGSELEKKFRKLSLFCKQVMARTGPDAYQRIRLQFDGQVIGQRRSFSTSAYDSLQVVRNVENLVRLMHSKQQQFEDSLSAVMGKPLIKERNEPLGKPGLKENKVPQETQKIKTTKTDQL